MRKLLIIIFLGLIASSCSKSVCECTTEYTYDDYPELNTVVTISAEVKHGDPCEETGVYSDFYGGKVKTTCVRKKVTKK